MADALSRSVQGQQMYQRRLKHHILRSLYGDGERAFSIRTRSADIPAATMAPHIFFEVQRWQVSLLDLKRVGGYVKGDDSTTYLLRDAEMADEPSRSGHGQRIC